MPCYFASTKETTNDYLINKIQNKKESCLFHICMLKQRKIIKMHLHIQMMNQQDLIIFFPLL